MHFPVHLLCSSARAEGRKEILAPACNPCWVVSWTGTASYVKKSGIKSSFSFQTTGQILSEQSVHHPFPHKKMPEQVIFWYFNGSLHKVFHPELKCYTLTVIKLNLFLTVFQASAGFFPTA